MPNTTTTHDRITMRLTTDDIANISILHDHLQRHSRFVDRTAVVRFALKLAARQVSGEEGGR